MKLTFTILLPILLAASTYGQSDSIRGNKYQLIGKIVETVQLPPHCGVIAWGTVIEFEVINVVGLDYTNKTIGIIVTCPEFYSDSFFVKGKIYKIIFSDKNQVDFTWLVPNKEILKKYPTLFDPYAIEIKKIP